MLIKFSDFYCSTLPESLFIVCTPEYQPCSLKPLFVTLLQKIWLFKAVESIYLTSQISLLKLSLFPTWKQLFLQSVLRNNDMNFFTITL